MKLTVIPVFIFITSFQNETNVRETESNWHFRENVKTCLQNKKAYLMPSARHSHSHPILILSLKMAELLQQNANTTVHWLQALPLPIVPKTSIFNVPEFLDPSLKTLPCKKLVRFRVKTGLFPYYFECYHL